MTPAKEDDTLQPVTVHFEQGLGQKFRQPSGTGIDFSKFEESELLKVNDTDVYPIAVKAEATTDCQTGPDGNLVPETMNSQITQAVFEKDKGEYQVRVLKQILWVNGMRYELQEIYGIGNSVEGDVDGNDPGKECVICLSEPRDTTVLPCRHMVTTSFSFLIYYGYLSLMAYYTSPSCKIFTVDNGLLLSTRFKMVEFALKLLISFQFPI